MDNSRNSLFDLLKESIRLNSVSLATLPGSLFLFFLIFSVDTLVGVFNAKAMYFLGFLIQILFSYGTGVLLFPRGASPNSSIGTTEKGIFEGVDTSLLKSLKPFAEYTQVSVFASILGYTIAYWLNLNFILRTKNVETVSLVYMAVLIMFLLFEIFILEEEWQSLVMSLMLGMVLGIVWANLTYQQHLVTMTEVPSGSFPSSSSDSSHTKVSTCSASSGNQNEDMVCRAFRL
jgi:hypothetical protein